MLTVVLGAGASYDSAPVHSSSAAKASVWRPPLTKDLFIADKAWFATGSGLPIPGDLRPVLDRIRRVTNQQSLEHALEQLKAEVGSFPDRWAQLIAIQEWLVSVLSVCTNNWIGPLAGVTTLVDLVTRLSDWRHKRREPINFITFNYDDLLELAIATTKSLPALPPVFDSYISDEYRVFKPHGSVTWWWQFRFDRGRISVRDKPLTEIEKATLELHCGPRRGGMWQTMWQTEPSGPTYSALPAIAIPVVSKSQSDFVFPPGHKEHMFAALNETTALLVIGWAGAEEHFMEEIRSKVKDNVPVLLVCDNGGQATLEILKDRGGLKSICDSNKGFAEFLDASDLEVWLDRLTAIA